MAVQFLIALLFKTEDNPNGKQDVHRSLPCVGVETKGIFEYVGGDSLAINCFLSDTLLVATYLCGPSDVSVAVQTFLNAPD